MSRAASAALVLSAAVFVAGCGTTGGGSSTPPASSGSGPGAATKSSAPRYNLTGYSAAFKQGYGDACATPRRRNAERLKADGDYSMGWQDGSSACRSR